MAVNPTVERNPTDAGSDGSIMRVTWVLLTANPIGTPVAIPEWADKTWIIGANAGDAFGGATCSLKGKNLNGETAVVLNKAATGATATAVAAGVIATIENPVFVYPELTSVGAGATVTVTVMARRPNIMRH